MARIFIPPAIRSRAGGLEVVDVPGATVRAAIAALDGQFPGMQDCLCQGDVLRNGWCVAVGGSVSSLGLLTKVAPDSEIHFLPLVGGG